LVIARRLSDNLTMQSALEIIAIAAVVVFIVLGLLSSVGRGSVYDQIGQGGLSMDRGHDDQPQETSDAMREAEIRQMLKARSERLVRQGKEPLDVESELAGLLAQDSQRSGPDVSHDPGLLEETRQLILARNERRRRAGLQELDVEAEVRRTLRELGT
jgi:hypothetical protein